MISACTQQTSLGDIVSGSYEVQDVSISPTASVPVLAAPENGSYNSTKTTAVAKASESYDLLEDDYRTHDCTYMQINPWK